MERFYKIEEVRIEKCGGNNYCFENQKDYLFDIPKYIDSSATKEYVELNTTYYKLSEIEIEYKKDLGHQIVICESWKIYKNLGNAKKEILKLMNI